MESRLSKPSHQRLLIFLLLVLALTCVISPWLAVGADWAATRWPALLSERVPFSRVFNRAFMVAGIILFILCRRFAIGDSFKTLLASDFRTGFRDLVTGLGLAILSMLLLVAAMTASDVFTVFFRLSPGKAWARFASAVSAGIFAGALEELFFRGLLFKGLYDNGGPLRAYTFANLFYSALHFVKPGQPYFLDGIQPLAGFRHLLTTFTPFLDPFAILPGIFGLFLIGIVLSYALVRSDKLYLGIGLHAGWIISLKMLRVFGDFYRADLGWLFGSTDPKIVSGVATFVGVFLVGIAVHYLTRKRARRAPQNATKSSN